MVVVLSCTHCNFIYFYCVYAIIYFIEYLKVNKRSYKPLLSNFHGVGVAVTLTDFFKNAALEQLLKTIQITLLIFYKRQHFNCIFPVISIMNMFIKEVEEKYFQSK